jgi:hypothetical protein
MRCLKCGRKAKGKSIIPLCKQHQKEIDRLEAYMKRTQQWDAKKKELEVGWYSDGQRPWFTY